MTNKTVEPKPAEKVEEEGKDLNDNVEKLKKLHDDKKRQKVQIESLKVELNEKEFELKKNAIKIEK